MRKFHSVHPPLSAGGGGVEPPIKSSKTERLGRTSTCRGGCWEKGGEFFQRRRLQFLHKKYNLKYLITKRVKAKRFFSVITKNWNWGILTKNSVTFKRKDGVKDETF